MAHTDGFFSVKDVASALDVCDETVYRRIRAGTLDALRIGDRIFLKAQHLIDAVERRSLGSKLPDQIDQTIAHAEQRDRAELNRGNGPVARQIGVTDDGVPIYDQHQFPDYDPRSARQLAAAPARAASLAAHNKGADTVEGDAGRRTIIRRLEPRPLNADGKPIPAGFKIAPAEDPQGSFAEQLADAVEVPA